jgi:hypothetical protein
MIHDNQHLPWVWYEVSFNPNITAEILTQHPFHPWKFGHLSFSLPITDILSLHTAHPTITWNWRLISANKSVTYQVVMNNPDLPWDWGNLCKNSNFLLSQEEHHDIIAGVVMKTHAARVIQRHWRHAIANPQYLVCRRRLLRELNESQNIISIAKL